MKPVNLNQERKARSKAERKAEADSNAVKHGRTKAQRLLEAAQAEALRKRLDQSRFDEE